MQASRGLLLLQVAATYHNTRKVVYLRDVFGLRAGLVVVNAQSARVRVYAYVRLICASALFGGNLTRSTPSLTPPQRFPTAVIPTYQEYICGTISAVSAVVGGAPALLHAACSRSLYFVCGRSRCRSFLGKGQDRGSMYTCTFNTQGVRRYTIFSSLEMLALSRLTDTYQ